MSDLEMYRILVESFEMLAKQRHNKPNKQEKEKREPDEETMEQIKKSIESPTNFHLANISHLRSDSERLITFEEKKQKQKQIYNKIKDTVIDNDLNTINETEIDEYMDSSKEPQTKSRAEIDNEIDNDEMDNNEMVEYESDFEDGFGMINVAKLKSEHFDNIPAKQTLKRQRSEEEVIGNMRYIYDVDENDNRVLVRRKSLSKISGIGYSLR